MEGRAVGGIITLSGPPDDIAGRTPERYVWDNRETLDSLNLCTLGEYVAAKSHGRDLAHCLKDAPTPAHGGIAAKTAAGSRTGPGNKSKEEVTVPDLAGMTYDNAARILQDQGLTVLPPTLGSPAPEKGLAGKVETTVAEHEGPLRAGDGVTLVVFDEPHHNTSLPRFVGLPAGEAADAAKRAGFAPEFEMGEETADPAQDGVVYRQIPSAATELPPGSRVTLLVHTLAAAFPAVPNVIGMPPEAAAAAVKGAGLHPVLELGDETQDKARENLAYRQTPAPGTTAEQGSDVVIRVYSFVARLVEVPNLVGLPVAAARRALQEQGLEVSTNAGIAAPTPGDSGKVSSQDPQPGREIETGKTVALRVYGDYEVPPPRAAPANSTATLERPAGAENAGARVFALARVVFTPHSSGLCKEDSGCLRSKSSGSGVLREHDYSLSEGTGRYHFQQTYERTGDVLSDYTVQFRFDSPPARFRAGDTLRFQTSGTAQGFTSGGYLDRSFTYYIKRGGGNRYARKSMVNFLNREMPNIGGKLRGELARSATTEITIPKTSKKEVVIGGKLGWDPGVFIDWIYAEVADAEPAASDGADAKPSAATGVPLLTMPTSLAGIKQQGQGLSLYSASGRGPWPDGRVENPDKIMQFNSYFGGRCAQISYESKRRYVSADGYYSDLLRLRVVWLAEGDDPSSFEKDLPTLNGKNLPPTGGTAKNYIQLGMQRSYILFWSNTHYAYVYGNCMLHDHPQRLSEYNRHLEAAASQLFEQVERYAKPRR